MIADHDYTQTISNEEWNIMDDSCVLLTSLADATKSLSGAEYVTISLVLPTVPSLVEDFSATFNAIKSKAGRKLKACQQFKRAS